MNLDISKLSPFFKNNNYKMKGEYMREERFERSNAYATGS